MRDPAATAAPDGTGLDVQVATVLEFVVIAPRAGELLDPALRQERDFVEPRHVQAPAARRISRRRVTGGANGPKGGHHSSSADVAPKQLPAIRSHLDHPRSCV